MSKTMTIEVNGKTLDANLADWEPGVADVMAADDKRAIR